MTASLANRLTQARRQRFVGLISMKERAAGLDGACKIVRLPDGGTRVTADLPLPLDE